MSPSNPTTDLTPKFPVLYPQGTSRSRDGTDECDVSIDIGNVLMRQSKTNTIESIPGNEPVPGARLGVQMLVSLFGRSGIHIISRCSEPAEEPLYHWLLGGGFIGDDPDQIIPGNVHFCRERHEKGTVLAGLRARCHVDNRAEVLIGTRLVSSMLARVLFTGVSDESGDLSLVGLPNLIVEPDWAALPGRIASAFANRL